MVDVQQLIKDKEAKFYDTRAKIEMEVDKFFETIKDIEAELADIPGRPQGSTAKTVLPSLWEEPFNKEKYDTELAVLNAYIKNVVAYGDQVNEEALRCLQNSV